MSVEDVRILSIRQPWAGLIVAGIKDVENRSWPTRYRGPLAVHAGLADDPAGWEMTRTLGVQIPDVRGAIIGVVTVADCVRDADSFWAIPDMWQWVLTDPVSMDPLPFRGRQGLIRAPAVVVEHLEHRR